MKIDLNAIDQEQFMVHPHIVNGETLWLVQPQHISAKWRQDNKHFRSSVWNDEGELVSAGFPKFVNWGENPENFPVPNSLKNTNIVEKLDGSLLIVSKYKGNIILRTRGTVDASKLDNGHELELFKERYLSALLKSNNVDTWNYSYLFEWTSPVQRIILSYGDEPEWTLVGAVNHTDYSLWTQIELDAFAKDKLLRPKFYKFPSIDELLKNIEEWKGKEGVCIYSKNDQEIHKIKSAWYLYLHRMKEALASYEKVVDVWFEQGQPSYQDFEQFIVNQFDWELWQQVRGDASKICDGYKEVNKIIGGMTDFVENTLRPLPTRKAQAEKVLSSYSVTNRASMVFSILDGKPLDKDQRKKLLYQVTKNK